jgi:lipopolysaccharide export system protein LptC
MRSSTWPTISSVFIAVFCIYALTAWHPMALTTSSNPKAENAFFSNLHYREYDEKGELKNQFEATKFSLLIDKEMLFWKPRFSILTDDHTPWTATSEKGQGYNNGEKIELTGNVHLTQWPTAQYPKTDITSNTLWIFPKKSFASTTDHIQINRPGMQVSGKGMQANLKNNHFILQKETTGFYTPSPKDAPYHFQSQSIHFNSTKKIAVLEKQAKIKQGNDTLHGDYVLYDIKKGLIKTKPLSAHHKTIIHLEPQKTEG